MLIQQIKGSVHKLRPLKIPFLAPCDMKISNYRCELIALPLTSITFDVDEIKNREWKKQFFSTINLETELEC